MGEAHQELEPNLASASATLLRQRWQSESTEQAELTTLTFELLQTPSVKAARRSRLLFSYYETL